MQKDDGWSVSERPIEDFGVTTFDPTGRDGLHAGIRSQPQIGRHRLRASDPRASGRSAEQTIEPERNRADVFPGQVPRDGKS
jgi:hypothetical protein